jgi:8-hydroxy-5-deazaflavin:NADPH oxidoreductase
VKKVAVLGSGPVGETLANGFLRHGYAVMRGSRDVGKLQKWHDSATGEAAVGTFEAAAAWSELVVLAVKGTAAEAIIKAIAPALDGKPVLDTTNPIADAPPTNGVLTYFTAQNESLMERLQALAPAAHFVKAWNSVGNTLMVNPQTTATPTMFICGNNAGAKHTATEILTQFGWETLDCGGVEAARPIESLCMLWCIPGFARNDWAHAFKMVYPT